MNRERTTPPVLVAPTHSKPEGEVCFVATEAAIHTVTLPEGSFAALVVTQVFGSTRLSMLSILDEDEVTEHIRLLRNAITDAKRLDAGLEPLDRSPLNAEEWFLLEWLSKEDGSQVGECKGAALSRLIQLGYADCARPDNDFAGVALSEAGWLRFKAGAPT